MQLDAALGLVRELFDAAIAAVDARAAVRRALSIDDGYLMIPVADLRHRLGTGRVVIVAAGKAAAAMSVAAEEVLGDHCAGGIALTKYGHHQQAATDGSARRVPVREAAHPTPDRAGREAAEEIRALLTSLGPDDLALCLISGGASALLTAPAASLDLDDLQQTTAALLAAGANINELNTVRKHLEVLKGGGLAACTAARVVALVVSDVLGDPLDVIASGPTVGDSSTFADAWSVIERHGLVEQLPLPVIARLQAGLRGEVPDTPMPDDPCFARTTTVVIANLERAVESAARRATELGWAPEAIGVRFEGEARETAREIVALAARFRDGRRRCLIGGGETTVTVRGTGVGGRNTEFALSAALAIDGQPDIAVASLATDGDDGPTGAAGAVATGETIASARALGLEGSDSLSRNDSATFFRQVGGLVVTGPTRTNVADLYCVLLEGEA